MPIKKYLEGASFGPETIQAMTKAFEDACSILNLRGPDDPLVEIVAKKVVSVASHGVLDPAEISRRVVADTDRP